MARILRLRLPDDEYRLYQGYAAQRDMSLAVLARQAIRSEIRKHARGAEWLGQLLMVDAMRILSRVGVDRLPGDGAK